MTIVYNSNCGHTAEYAKLLGDKLNLPVVEFRNLHTVGIQEELILMSWVCASMITKLDKVRAKYKLICVVGVGMTVPSEENTAKLIELNKLTIPFFYLQGGLDYTKLKGIKKAMLKMVAKKVTADNRPEDQKMIALFKHGGNCVSEAHLGELISFLKKKED